MKTPGSSHMELRGDSRILGREPGFTESNSKFELQCWVSTTSTLLVSLLIINLPTPGAENTVQGEFSFKMHSKGTILLSFILNLSRLVPIQGHMSIFTPSMFANPQLGGPLGCTGDC
ncbi:hypothetical protein T439DRAFT_325883 [Meredithblackwellia eburnea MCA 4105]